MLELDKQTSMENIMMIKRIFNRIGITNNYLRLVACKMLCMCFIISTLAFAQSSSGGRSIPLDPSWTPLSHEEKMLLIEQGSSTVNRGDIISRSTRQGGDTFADAVAITFPYNGSGTTVGYENDYGPFDDPTNILCDPNSSPSWGLASDVVYKLTLLESMNIAVNLDGSNYDTALGVYDSSNTALVLANDDYNNLQSYVQCDLSPGTYYIVVDGFMTDEGDYEIAVHEHMPPEEFAYIEVSEHEAFPGDSVSVYVNVNAAGYMQGAGTFTGEYYQGNPGPSPEFGELVLVREDPVIDFWWGDGSPDPSIDGDYFQVRWTGDVHTNEDGVYQFHTYSDDGVRLMVDGDTLINQWYEYGGAYFQANVTLEEGYHEVVLEYYENGGGAAVSLSWITTEGFQDLVRPEGEESTLNAAEFEFAGFQNHSVDLTGITIDPSFDDWSMDFNNTDSVLYVAMAGANGVHMSELGTLFSLDFHVNEDASFGDVPVDVVHGILNTDSPYWEIEQGGIWIMNPNQPPSAFNLLSPGNGSTLSITPDNVQDVLTFSWEPSIDPEGDQVEYMFATIPSFVVGNDTVTPGFGFVNLGNMLGAAVPYSALIDTMTSYGVESVVLEWGIAATDGRWYSGLSFGEEGQVEVPHNDNLNFGSGDFALSLWFIYWGFDESRSSMQLLAKHDNDADQYELQLDRLGENWDSEALLRCYIGGDTFASDIELRIGALYHAVLSRQNGVVSMFINGEMAGMMTSSSNASADASLYLGHDQLFDNETFSGILSNVIIFDRGVSETEVGVLFDEGTGINNELLFEGAPNDLTLSRVSHWPLNSDIGIWSFQPTQGIVYDQVGSNNGMLYNANYNFASTNNTWLWNNEVPWVLYIDLSELSTDNIHMPLEFTLHQNYPNPFNPITSIRYDLPNAGKVSLVIYDMMGREVRTLLNNNTEAGFQSVTWDATNNFGNPVGAGVYIYQIKADGFIQSKKMILLK